MKFLHVIKYMRYYTKYYYVLAIIFLNNNKWYRLAVMSTFLFNAGTNSLWNYAAKHLMHMNFPKPQREYMVYKLKAEWGSTKGGVRSTPFQIPAEYFHRPRRCYLSRYLAGFMLVVSQNLFRHDSVIPRTRGTRVFRSSRTLAMNRESPIRSRLPLLAKGKSTDNVPLFKRSDDVPFRLELRDG